MREKPFIIKCLTVLIFLTFFLFQWKASTPQEMKNIQGHSIVGVFDGRTPCQELAKQFNEKVTTECIKIKWRLTLCQDSLSLQPSIYKLEGFIYKRENPRTGKWHIIKSTGANPEAVVYRLDLEEKEPIFLQKGDDNILFFLDKEMNIMVGNRDFSYTLNRVDKIHVN